MFITVEGIEGCGKTTQSRLLAERLVAEGYSVTLTHEPGWGVLGSRLREILLEDVDIALDPFAELCLFCADRAQHVKELIRPRLLEGDVVICDRFSDSTVAYQGYGRGCELELVKRLAWEAARGEVPDATVLLDLSVEEGLRRIGVRAGKTKMEAEDEGFHERVRRGFLEIASQNPGRVLIVDGSGGIEETFENMWSALRRKLDVLRK
ncbi:MAG: dTMP kinase [Candidatus Caldarchaeum sp.]